MIVKGGQSYRVVVSYKPRDSERLKLLGEGLLAAGMTDAELYETGGSYTMHRTSDGVLSPGETAGDVTVLHVMPIGPEPDSAPETDGITEAIADVHETVQQTSQRLMLISLASAVAFLLMTHNRRKLKLA